jgi:hypothetical protein
MHLLCRWRSFADLDLGVVYMRDHLARCAPPVHMIELTATQEITPYKWVHPEEER